MALIIVSGAIANKPFNGGEAWVRLSWIGGFRKLGFDVCFVEQISSTACLDRRGNPCDFSESVCGNYFADVVKEFRLSSAAAVVDASGASVYGLSQSKLNEAADSAALLVNISGHLTCESLRERFRCTAYVDIDPGFTQYWHVDPTVAFTIPRHDFYFTIGENIGHPECAIPTGDLAWQSIRQPVVMEDWPVVEFKGPRRFTTIANWRGPFGCVEFGDKRFGLKVHEFRKFIELPQRSPHEFEAALNIHPSDERDLNALQHNGWRIVDPSAVANTPSAFRLYVQGSAAEFSVAQGIYVDTQSGWFSDRTIRYLASGRPALVQNTGFTRRFPAGEGLIAVRTLDEAISGAEMLMGDYDRHARAARSIAEEFFDSDRVLRTMLDQIGIRVGA